MAKPINDHEGSKYIRVIRSAINDDRIWVDVYAVLEAFNVTCPARQQAIKKLLCAGLRGKGSELDDLAGADAAVSRAIELEKTREAIRDSAHTDERAGAVRQAGDAEHLDR